MTLLTAFSTYLGKFILFLAVAAIAFMSGRKLKASKTKKTTGQTDEFN